MNSKIALIFLVLFLKLKSYFIHNKKSYMFSNFEAQNQSQHHSDHHSNNDTNHSNFISRIDKKLKNPAKHHSFKQQKYSLRSIIPLRSVNQLRIRNNWRVTLHCYLLPSNSSDFKSFDKVFTPPNPEQSIRHLQSTVARLSELSSTQHHVLIERLCLNESIVDSVYYIAIFIFLPDC